MRCISSFAGVIETKTCKAGASGLRKSWDGLPILLPEQRFPFLSSFCHQCAERSFLLAFSLSYRETRVCLILAPTVQVHIARLEERRLEGGGDFIALPRRGDPLQLWMNFWFELTKRRLGENTDNNRRKGDDSQRFSAMNSRQPTRFIFPTVTAFVCRWLTREGFIFRLLENADKVEIIRWAHSPFRSSSHWHGQRGCWFLVL